MKPIKFAEMSGELQKPEGWTSKQCLPLPVYTDGQQCISCWEISWRERVKLLLRGKIWLCIYSGDTQPPVWLDVDYPFEAEHE